MEWRRQGYNCAQCVLMAFEDVTGLSPEAASKVALALGGGTGGSGNICGALTGAAVAEGFTHAGAPSDKAASYARTNRVIDRFRAENGHVDCRDLKGAVPPRPCNDLIKDAVRILHEELEGDEA